MQKKKLDTDKLAVIEAVTRACKGTRKVEFSVYVMVDHQERGAFELIIEVTKVKKTEKRRAKWKKQGYELQECKEKKFEVPVNQTFVVRYIICIMSASDGQYGLIYVV